VKGLHLYLDLLIHCASKKKRVEKGELLFTFGFVGLSEKREKERKGVFRMRQGKIKNLLWI